MRNCVLISGLPRQVEKCYENINSCIIKPNNADVFIHSWVEESDSTTKNSIINKYNPKKFEFETQKPFLNDYLKLERMMSSHGSGYTRANFVSMLYNQFYSILKCNLIKEKHRLENNIQYDYVARARFDIEYNQKIIFSEYPSDFIYTPNCRALPPEMIEDRFAFGSNALMNLYCSLFNNIESIYQKKDCLDGIICGETLVFELIKFHNIKNTHLNGLVIQKAF
jgi:hypothetical protein